MTGVGRIESVRGVAHPEMAVKVALEIILGPLAAQEAWPPGQEHVNYLMSLHI